MDTKTGRAPPPDVLAKLGEVFRAHGFEGASLTLIGRATGLGKGSLYHLFPGGKAQMLSAVLAEIDAWFEGAVFAPLDQADDARAAVAAMFAAVDRYFRSGERVCLVGAVGLNATRDPFAGPVAAYFARWIAALARCLAAGGLPRDAAQALAEEAVAGIQGALVLARALDDTGSFLRITAAQRARLLAALAGRGGAHS